MNIRLFTSILVVIFAYNVVSSPFSNTDVGKNEESKNARFNRHNIRKCHTLVDVRIIIFWFGVNKINLKLILQIARRRWPVSVLIPSYLWNGMQILY